MARYDYKCPACGTVFEVEHGMNEHPTPECPRCGASAERVFSASGIVLSGSGFYNTDQRGSLDSAAHVKSASSEKSDDSASKKAEGKAASQPTSGDD